MLQEVEVTNPVGRRLKIEVPTAVVEKELDEVYKHLRTTVNIPGFRKGKVPRTILERRFSKNVEAEVVSKLVPEFYSEAIKEAGIVPVSQPNIEGDVKIEKAQPLSFSVTVEIKPEIKDLKYEGIEIEEVEVEVSEEDGQNALKTLREQKSSFEPAEDSASEGDMLVIDFEGLIEGEPIEGLKEADYEYVIGSQTLPEEFGKELSGKSNNDSCEFTVSFNDDFHNKSVAGKTVLFKTVVKEVKKKIVPDLDDEFAKDLNYENLDELKAALSEELKLKKEKERDTLYRTSLIKTLMDTHEVEAPPSMVKIELDALMAQAKNMAMLSGMKEPDVQELYSVYRETAVNNVKSMLILGAIGTAEKVEVSDDEVKKRIDQLAQNISMKAEEIVKMYVAQDGSLDGFKQQMFTDKVLDLILSKASIKKKSSLIVE